MVVAQPQRQPLARTNVRPVTPLTSSHLPAGMVLAQAGQQQPQVPNGQLVSAATHLTHQPVGQIISHELAAQQDPRFRDYLRQRRHTLVPSSLAAQGGVLHAALGPSTQQANPLLTSFHQAAAPAMPHYPTAPAGVQGHPRVQQMLSGGAVPSVPQNWHMRLDRRRSDTSALQSFMVQQQQQPRDSLDHSSGPLHASGSGSGVGIAGTHVRPLQLSNLSVLEQGMDRLQVESEPDALPPHQSPSTRPNRHPPLTGRPPLFDTTAHPLMAAPLQPIQSPSPDSMDDSNPHPLLHATESSPAGPIVPGPAPQHNSISRLGSAPHCHESNAGAFAQLVHALGPRSGPGSRHLGAYPSPDPVTRTLVNQPRRGSLSLDTSRGQAGPGAHGQVANAAGGHFYRSRPGRRFSHVAAQVGQGAAYVPAVEMLQAPARALDHTAGLGEDDARSVREGRYLISPDFTTSLPRPNILQEIRRVLDASSERLQYAHNDCTFIVQNTEMFEKVYFEIQICQIPGISNLRCLRFHRLDGDLFQYKYCTQRLVEELKLK